MHTGPLEILDSGPMAGPNVAQARPGYELWRPNREKAESQRMKSLVAFVLVVTDSAFSRLGRQSSYPGLISPTLTPTIIESRSDDAAFSAR